MLHHELAKEAILAGKHVFVEKPMTLSVDHSLELVELAEKHGRILMVGHLLLYHPCVCAIREMILRGEIGDVRYVYSQRLNLGKVRSDENALVSLAPHDISVILHLIGKAPEIVGATGGCFIRSGIEDVVFLSLGFSGGVRAHAHVSWLDPHKVRRVTVVGSKKMIEFDDMEPQEKVRVYDKGVDRSGEFGTYGEFLTLRDGDIHIPDIPMMEPLARECAHFVECIETGKTPVSDGRNGLLVTRVLDAGLRSLKEGGTPVMVEGRALDGLPRTHRTVLWNGRGMRIRLVPILRYMVPAAIIAFGVWYLSGITTSIPYGHRLLRRAWRYSRRLTFSPSSANPSASAS